MPNPALPDYDREHDVDSADCWCEPTVEEYPAGRLIIHRCPEEAVEEAQRILDESKPFEGDTHA